MTIRPIHALALACALMAFIGCADDRTSCGPVSGTVAHVVDGDTVVLDSGERVRYLLIDTPEIADGDCYAREATALNEELVLGREVTLHYDIECTDRFGRLLAYVYVGESDINRILVERGYACQLHIPPNGAERADEFLGLELQAEREGRGMWGQCQSVACD